MISSKGKGALVNRKMNNIQFKSFYKSLYKYQEKINSELEMFFSDKIKENSLLFKQAAETIEILKNINLGAGKKIRPILINIGYFLSGGKNKKAILEACLCIEFIHNWFLIHDDIIDRDDFRRGKLSLHKFYEKRTKDTHMGISLAITAGDINVALGYQALVNNRFKEKFKNKALNVFNETIVNTLHGEMLELSIKKNINKFKEKDILNVCKYKTAYYTFINPLKIGAILAGANNRFLDQIEKFALPIGIAFQIHDDILGLFATKRVLGKPIASDIEENQPNLLVYKTLTSADKIDKCVFKKYLGKEKLNQKEIKEIRRIVKKSGAFNYCEDLANSLVKEAKSILVKMRVAQKEKKFLLSMADYIIDREY